MKLLGGGGYILFSCNGMTDQEKLQKLLDDWIEGGAEYEGSSIYNHFEVWGDPPNIGLNYNIEKDRIEGYVVSFIEVFYNPTSNFFQVMFPTDGKMHTNSSWGEMKNGKYYYEVSDYHKMQSTIAPCPIEYVYKQKYR